MKFENTEVCGFKHAIRGMRNPHESWNKSDSVFGVKVRGTGAPVGHKSIINSFDNGFIEYAIIGENDLHLMQGLIKAGSEHRKFMRQIFVSVDITAPSYFMAELDTYKVGVTRDSTSFQHRGTVKRFDIDDFEVDEDVKEVLRIRENEFPDLFYPYETEDFRLYRTENGRTYKIYKNGKIVAMPFSYVDTKGRERFFEEKEIKPSKTRTGYFEINLGGSIREKWLLHRLVAEVWLDNPCCYKTVDHKNGNKADNSVENLEWVSLEENVRREWGNFEGFDLARRYKTWKLSSKVLPPERAKIKALYDSGKYTQKQLSEMFDLKQAQISVVCRNVDSSTDKRELFERCYYWESIIDALNALRDKYLETKDYRYFRNIRQLLPMSYLYRSTITMSYENVLNMVRQRKNHKLTEWSVQFMEWVRSLPYADELLFLK